MLRISHYRIITNVDVYKVCETIEDVLTRMEGEMDIKWKYSGMYKHKEDYHIVYNVVELLPYYPNYNIQIEYFREGFGIIDVGVDEHAKYSEEIENKIYEILKEIDDGSEIKPQNVTRKVLLNKILTTKSLDKIEQIISSLLNEMKKEGKIMKWYKGSKIEENGDISYYYLVDETTHSDWLMSFFCLREGYTIIYVHGSIDSRYDYEFMERLIGLLRRQGNVKDVDS